MGPVLYIVINAARSLEGCSVEARSLLTLSLLLIIDTLSGTNGPAKKLGCKAKLGNICLPPTRQDLTQGWLIVAVRE